MAKGDNTKARSEAIQQAAADLLVEMGVDVTEAVPVRPLAKILEERNICHYTTGRIHIAKAVRRARGEMVKQHEGWGGARDGAGYPAGEPRKHD